MQSAPRKKSNESEKKQIALVNKLKSKPVKRYYPNSSTLAIPTYLGRK
jgi:hypothetical protein